MKSPKQFFLDINDFKAVKVDQELMNVERSLKKKLSKVQQEKEKVQKEREERKKQAMKQHSFSATFMLLGIVFCTCLIISNLSIIRH